MEKQCPYCRRWVNKLIKGICRRCYGTSYYRRYRELNRKSWDDYHKRYYESNKDKWKEYYRKK